MDAKLTIVGSSDRYLIRDECKTHSYAMVMLRTTPEECKARAETIVRAVNSHEDLVAALHKIVEYNKVYARNIGRSNCGSQLSEIAQSALKKAGQS